MFDRAAARDWLVNCFRPHVVGRPSWLASHLAQGLCRIKWLCFVFALLWVSQAWGIIHIHREYFEPAASRLGYPASAIIIASAALGIAGAAFALVAARDGISISGARRLAGIVGIATIGSQGLIWGLAHLAPERVAALDMTLFIALAMAPLGIAACAGLLCWGLGVAVLVAKLTGLELSGEHLTFLIHPASMAALGVAVNRWYVGTFRSEYLGRLRLQRTLRQVRRQSQVIEHQRNEAMTQRSEIAKQGDVIMHALASALTEPVAQAYVRGQRFETTLKTVCVIACDAVGFSDTCRKLQPERVVKELEAFFREFDAACLKFRVEPLRAQGDSRIAIAGLWPDETRNLHQEAISAVLAMLHFREALPPVGELATLAQPARVLWPARIGICLGPASCGVIETGEGRAGTATGRLWFDVWGDTVNLAARLQEAASPNQLMVRESVLWETCGLFEHGPIHEIRVKSTTLSDAVEVKGIRRPYRDEAGKPNAAFWEIFNDSGSRPLRPNPAGSTTAPAAAGE